jgi:hypothetical protein
VDPHPEIIAALKSNLSSPTCQRCSKLKTLLNLYAAVQPKWPVKTLDRRKAYPKYMVKEAVKLISMNRK